MGHGAAALAAIVSATSKHSPAGTIARTPSASPSPTIILGDPIHPYLYEFVISIGFAVLLSFVELVLLGSVIYYIIREFQRWHKRTEHDILTVAERRNLQSRGMIAVLLAIAGLGLVWIPFAPGLHGNERAWALVELTAVGIMLSAGFFGFLFGLIRPDASSALNAAVAGAGAAKGVVRTTPITNLEEVAARVAQLITGAAFANLALLPNYVGRFANFFDAQLNVAPGWKGIKLLGGALLLYFTPLGFVIAYSLTRTIGVWTFTRFDEELFGGKSRQLLRDLPLLPDIGISKEPTPEQRENALRIATGAALAELVSVTEKAMWARAQTILGCLKAAELAYQQAIALNENDPALLLDYATVLYNDPTYKDVLHVIELSHKVERLLSPGASGHVVSSDLLARALALRAMANLYHPNGGYFETIDIVNRVLKDANLTPPKVIHFSRACAFGQLYRVYRKCVSRPHKLGHTDISALSEIINRDIAVTLGFGSRYRELALIVVDPMKRPAEQAEDDDLQAFAIIDQSLRKQLGLHHPPPFPSSSPPPFLPLSKRYSSVAMLVRDCAF